MSEENEVPVEEVAVPVQENEVPAQEAVAPQEVPVEEKAESKGVKLQNVNIGVGFCEVSSTFILRLESEGAGAFETRLDKSNFENLSAKMIRLLQEVNLKQAQEYQKRLADEEAQKECGESGGCGQAVPDQPIADQPSEAQPEQS
jgi:hypothetical protein